MYPSRARKASDSLKRDSAPRPTSNGAYGSFWSNPAANTHSRLPHTQHGSGHNRLLSHTQQLPQFRDSKSEAGSRGYRAVDNRNRGDHNNLLQTAPHDNRLNTANNRLNTGEDGRSRQALPASRGGLNRLPRTRAFAQPSGFRGLQQLNEQSSLPAVRQRHAQGSGQLSVGNLHSAVQPKTPQGHPHSPQTPSRIGKRQGSPAVRSSLRTPQQRSPQHEREAASNSVLQGPTTTQVRPPRHTATREQQSTEHRRRTATTQGSFGAKSMAGAYPAGMGRVQSKENQDNFFTHDIGGGDFYVGVVDGHGLAGKQVSGYVGEHLGKKVATGSNSTDSSAVEQHFRKAFQSTAEELKRSGIEASESGTTAVTALRKGNDLFVANVGDSRCVLAREGAGGKLDAVAMSEDHKPDRQDERHRIVRNHGCVEPLRGCNGRFVGPSRVWTQKQVAGGLAVSRAFGDFSMEKAGVVADPEIKKERLSSKDKFLVLASDGVWEHLNNQQVVDIAKKHKDPKQASDAIVSEARKQWQTKGCGYIDDITAVVMRVDQ